MELRYSELALEQFDQLSTYLEESFGRLVAFRKTAELKAFIGVVGLFPGAQRIRLYPLRL